MDDQEIAKQLAKENRTGPRITAEQVERAIKSQTFHQLTPTLMVCVVTLHNGYELTGESACAAKENYSETLAMKISAEKARAKVWPLFGFMLRDELYQMEQRSRGEPQPFE